MSNSSLSHFESSGKGDLFVRVPLDVAEQLVELARSFPSKPDAGYLAIHFIKFGLEKISLGREGQKVDGDGPCPN